MKVELTNVSGHGLWLMIDDEELALPFDQFPWFRDATIAQLSVIERPSPDHLHWPLLDVDLTGPFLLTREFAAHVIQNKVPASVVINISSIARHGNPGQSNYSAAKAGLIADTKLWAIELARYGIRTGALAPGFIDTPILQGMRPDVLDGMLKPVPLRRVGTPGEIFSAVKVIIDCDYFTGRCVDVDGGLTL
jgi:3-oxoacyl-[acyl-carrier protein] reductase